MLLHITAFRKYHTVEIRITEERWRLMS